MLVMYAMENLKTFKNQSWF